MNSDTSPTTVAMIIRLRRHLMCLVCQRYFLLLARCGYLSLPIRSTEKCDWRSCRAAWALLRGDRFDDEAVFAFWVERDGCAGFGFSHKFADGGLVQCFCRGEADVFDDAAGALQPFFRIGEWGAAFLRLEEEEADPTGKDGDGEDGLGGALGGAEADGEGVVVVVDELEGGGVAFAHFCENVFGERGYFGREFQDEGCELLRWRWGGILRRGHARLSGWLG
jgi:hypothetical protein